MSVRTAAKVAAIMILFLPAAAAFAQDAFGGDTKLDEAKLGAIAGRADVGTQIAEADQQNTVSNNIVSGNSVTGMVQIDGNAFQNLNGLAIINANSGNNVAINASMNVNISLGGMPN